MTRCSLAPSRGLEHLLANQPRGVRGFHVIARPRVRGREHRVNHFYPVKPSPLFTQQQSILTTLVDAWEGANADEKKHPLAGIFDSITASADGVDRLEPLRRLAALHGRGYPEAGAGLTRCGCHRSGRRDSNPRPPPWQGGALPLRHFRESSADRDYIVSVVCVPATCA